MSPQLTSFLKTGIKPPSDRERSALLDEARSFCESIAAEARNWTPPETPAQVEQIKRSADAGKLQREKARADLDKRVAAQREKLRQQAASKTATKSAAPAARPFEKDSTQNLVVCVRKNYFTGAQLEAAQAELAARNVVMHAKGFSISSITTTTNNKPNK